MVSNNWQAEYLHMLADCRDRFGALDDWELNFIESLGDQFKQPLFIPSPKQVEKLEQIWERVTHVKPVAANQADLFGDFYDANT